MREGVSKSLFLQLKDFLAGIGDVDSVEERNDLLLSTEFGYLSPKINKQGSPDEFISGLLIAISREGQDQLAKFLDQLGKARDLSVEDQNRLKELLETIATLSLKKWLEIFPSDSITIEDNLFWQVHQLLEQRKIDDAEQKLARATNIPGEAIYWYWKAEVAFKKNSFDAALAYSDEALKQDGSHIYSLALKIKLLLLNGNVKKAKTLAEASYGIAHRLDIWLNCLKSHNFLLDGPWTNYELETECPFPTYQWNKF